MIRSGFTRQKYCLTRPRDVNHGNQWVRIDILAAGAECLAPSRGENRMTLPTNDDFSSGELSIEELDAIAAGGFFGSIWHGIESGASAVWHAVSSPTGQRVIGSLLPIAALVVIAVTPGPVVVTQTRSPF
jgi:hypothetical protein